MKDTWKEETILFASVLKWVVLATFVGAIVGFSTAIFLKILNLGISITTSHSYYFVILPVAFLLSTVLIRYLAPDAEGHGTEKVIEAVHKYSGKIKATVVPVKLLATVVTIAGGGSAGKEGPAAQIGAGLASIFADIFKFEGNDLKKLVICGISAGFAAVFGTPISGAIFGVEVLYAGSILYEVLLPSFISGIIGYHISSSLGVTYFYYPIRFTPVFSEIFMIKVILAGIFFGITARIFIELMGRIKSFEERFRIAKEWKALIGGAVLVILTFIFSDKFLGLGLDTIQQSLEGGKIIWYAFLLKMLYTSVTLNCGGSGGIITPIFFIGATAGSFYATVLGLDRSTFAAIGLVSLLAGAANTPIAGSIMAVELFGPAIAPYASIASVLSFVMTGHKSVYPSQVLAIRKSSSISIETGKEMDEVTPKPILRKKSLAYLLYRIMKFFEGKIQRRGE